MGVYMGDIFKWWALLLMIGLITFPISFFLFRKTYDKGYMFSKVIGLFLIGYLSWLLGFIHFSTATIWIVIALLTGLSAFIFVKLKGEIMDFLNRKLGLILVTELFFFFVFFLFAHFRMYQPDIIGTEKFMDFAFMNAISKADMMPPFDPWMAGEGLYISYYYFGYVIMAALTKISAVPNSIAYNLALTSVVALSAVTMVGLLYNLTKNYLIGFLAAAFLLLISNLDGFIQVVNNGWSTVNFNWWHSSRIIDYPDYDITINEFPFFSFLLGDMHPHQMAIPFALLALNSALMFIRSEDKELFGIDMERLPFIIFTGLLLGGLWFMNSWDLPTYFFITALAVFANRYSMDADYKNWIRDAGITLGVILGVAIAAYLPFTLFFSSQAKGIGLVKANTKITDFLVLFGIMLFPVVSFLVARLLNWIYAVKVHGIAGGKEKKRDFYCPRCGSDIRDGKKICGQCGYMISGEELYLGGIDLPVKKTAEPALSFFKFFASPGSAKSVQLAVYAAVPVAIAIGLIVYKTLLDRPNFGVFGGLIFLVLAFILLLGLTRTELKENQFALIMVFTALFAIFGCEFFHIIDSFSRPGGHAPLERMNTVFKFYYQAWILLAAAAAYCVFWVRHFYLKFQNKAVRIIWNVLLAALIVMGLFYPFAASDVKLKAFRGYLTLDGMDFLRTTNYKGRMPAMGDFQAIQWLNTNIKGAPVIAEAHGGQYTEFARISSFTGLPTIIGWPGHELQWRGSGDEAGRRTADVDRLYTTVDINEAMELIRKYNVEYVYLGVLEKDKYASSQEGLAKFTQFMDIAYTNRLETTIYRVRK